MREALRLLAEQDRLREAHLANLRAALATGLEQADPGDLLDGPEVIDEMRAFLREARPSGGPRTGPASPSALVVHQLLHQR